MNVGREIASLQRMTVQQLRQKYAEVFDEQTNAAANEEVALDPLRWSSDRRDHNSRPRSVPGTICVAGCQA